MDRTKQPEFHGIKNINYTKAIHSSLKNGIPLYTLKARSEEVIKLDLLFEAGTWYQKSSLIASFTNSLLGEGTTEMSSAEISEKLDFYGAYLYANTEKDLASVSLFCQSKHFAEVIKILADIVKNPIFSDEEFSTLLNKRKEQFLVESGKVKTIAHKEFQKVIFGNNYPYGNYAELNDFVLLQRTDLLEFYNSYYHSNNCRIIISGYVEDKTIELLDKHLGQNDWQREKIIGKNDFTLTSSENKMYVIEKKDSVQSAIRVGKLLFNKTHPDYMRTQVLNTVLGGYFGSRLMTNIREDKGYTYGIGSMLGSLLHAGFFTIITETGSEYAAKTIDEIKYEMQKLQTKKISSSELDRVKNYMLGELVRSFDGPFEMSDSFKSLLEYDLSYDYIDKFIETIQVTSPDELIDLANKYLDFDTMKVVVVGKTRLFIYC